MSTSSEAVMVSPEQCATAPKTLTKGLASQPATPSATRLVLLSVLALAAATGAMFGVVVFGNEFTKDVHPKGDSYQNAVTLVDTNDRAIATADVESYVSLLDLPLLGTAELNKVDGITFSTHQGVQHRKVTGYDVTKETATIGSSVAETPRLSLATADSGVTIEVSVRDSRAWVQQSSSGASITTEIHLSSQRRLTGDSGSCLSNGACLYSQDELLRMSAATRELSEGSFFARADVAAYQVDLNGDDVMQYLSDGDAHVTYLTGSYKEDGHTMQLRASASGAGKSILFTNISSGVSKFITVNGTWLFEGRETTGCSRPTTKSETLLKTLNLEELAVSGAVAFDSVSVHTSAPVADFFPHGISSLTRENCLDQQISRSNMSDPSAQNFWQERTGVSFTPADGNSARKLAKEHFKPMTHKQRHESSYREMRALMENPNNEINRFHASARGKNLRELHLMKYNEPNSKRPKRNKKRDLAGNEKRELWSLYGDSDSDSDSAYLDKSLWKARIEDMLRYVEVGSTLTGATMAPASYITHFDLWVSTRLADPTFLHNAYVDMDEKQGMIDTFGYADSSGSINPSFIFDLSGHSGISHSFASWAMFLPVSASYFPEGLGLAIMELEDTSIYSGSKSELATDTSALAAVSAVEQGLSKAFFHMMYPGSCSGGYEFNNDAVMDLEVGADLCEGHGFGEQGFEDDYWESMFDSDVYRRRLTEDDRKSEGRTLYKSKKGEKRELAYTEADGQYEAYDAFDSYCASFMNGDEPVYAFDRYDLGLKQGNSWASYLVKELSPGYPEYVVAFQGTKAGDSSMLAYQFNQKPLFTYIGYMPVIVPEGVYWYMESLATCMLWMIDPGNGFDIYSSWMDSSLTITSATEPTFITGHSLGGNAATLFIKSKTEWVNPSSVSGTYPRLVTFGSPPNVYRGKYHSGLIGCMEGIDANNAGKSFLSDTRFCDPDDGLLKMGFEEYAEYLGGMSNYCSAANPQSVRFYHKFDPVPSQGLWKGQFAHGVEHAMLLYDMPDSGCGDISGCELSATSLSSDASMSDLELGGDPYMIKDYLCDKWAVEPKALYTSCYDEITSYMTMMAPWPCGEIIFHRIWKEEWETSQLEKIGDNGIIDVMWGNEGLISVIDMVALTGEHGTLFKKFEEYTDCVESYEASLGAYIQAAIVDMPDLAPMMFALFGFLWVHSTYGNYPLCTDLDGTTGELIEFNIDAADEAAIYRNECSNSELMACEADCSSSKAKKEDSYCFWECSMGCYSTTSV
jgi:hypothetical protein